MLRWMLFGCVALLGLSEVASAATISAVLMPYYADSNGDVTLTGYVTRKESGALSEFYAGPITTSVPVATLSTSVFVNLPLDGGIALVRTDISRQAVSGATRVALTTYANFYPGSGGTSVGGSVIDYVVNNRAYWEFELVGNYDWRIEDTDPATRGIGSKNFRTYDFVKVTGATETSLAKNVTGKGSLNPQGTAEIGSGTYRLYFHHYDSSVYTDGTMVNSVDLNIFFTLKSEDTGSSGVVPEPSSVAVFGLLSLGGAVAKWRRKKLQPAA